MTNDFWTRVQRMCQAMNPNLLNGGLHPPATEAQIDAAEKAMNVSFPPDLRHAYLCFNGMGPFYNGSMFWLSEQWVGIGAMQDPAELMYGSWLRRRHFRAGLEQGYPASTLKHFIESDEEADASGRPTSRNTWQLSRIQVSAAASLGSDGLRVDTCPPPAGTPGQLVYRAGRHDYGVVAPSFTAGVELVLNAFERGEVAYDPVKKWHYIDNSPHPLNLHGLAWRKAHPLWSGRR